MVWDIDYIVIHDDTLNPHGGLDLSRVQLPSPEPLVGSLGHCDLWQEWSFPMSGSEIGKWPVTVSDGQLGGSLGERYEITLSGCKIWYKRCGCVIETVWFYRMISQTVRCSTRKIWCYSPDQLAIMVTSIFWGCGSLFRPWKAKGLSFQPFDRRSIILFSNLNIRTYLYHLTDR